MNTMTLWLLEDDIDDVYMLQSMLNRTNLQYQLTTYPTLTSLVLAAQQEKPDVAMVDLNLPDSQGFKTFLVAREALADVPVLVLTGLESDELGELCVAMGAQDYLCKEHLNYYSLSSAIRYAKERQSLINQLRSQIEIDELTLLYNKKAFIRHLESNLMQFDRTNHLQALIFLDIDDFKQINDQYGHLIGDQALNKFAQHLRNSIRSTDLAGRFGGDEFTVFINNLSHKEQLKSICENFLAGFERPFKLVSDDEIVELKVRASLGALLICRPLTVDEALQYSDDLMYEVKRTGKGRYRIDEVQ